VAKFAGQASVIGRQLVELLEARNMAASRTEEIAKKDTLSIRPG
jgi:hypothetical protein